MKKIVDGFLSFYRLVLIDMDDVVPNENTRCLSLKKIRITLVYFSLNKTIVIHFCSTRKEIKNRKTIIII